MKALYVKIDNLNCDSKTILAVSNNCNRESMWTSAYKPTISNDILSRPIINNFFENEPSDKNNGKEN